MRTVKHHMLSSFSNCAGGDHLKEWCQKSGFFLLLTYFWHIKCIIIPIYSCTNKSEITFNMVESSIMKTFLSPIRIIM